MKDGIYTKETLAVMRYGQNVYKPACEKFNQAEKEYNEVYAEYARQYNKLSLEDREKVREFEKENNVV